MGLEKSNLHPSHVKSILFWWKCVFTSHFKGFHVSKCVSEREIYTPPTRKAHFLWESVFLPHVFEGLMVNFLMITHIDLYVKTRIWDDVKRRINASRTLRVYVFLYVYMCFYIQVRVFDCLIEQLNWQGLHVPGFWDCLRYRRRPFKMNFRNKVLTAPGPSMH